MNEKNLIRTNKGSWRGETLIVRGFKERSNMHKFLNDGDNANHWRECDESKGDPMKPGKYKWAGQQWHDIKKLDPTTLAHL